MWSVITTSSHTDLKPLVAADAEESAECHKLLQEKINFLHETENNDTLCLQKPQIHNRIYFYIHSAVIIVLYLNVFVKSAFTCSINLSPSFIAFIFSHVNVSLVHSVCSCVSLMFHHFYSIKSLKAAL